MNNAGRVASWNVGLAVVALAGFELLFGEWFVHDPLRGLDIPRHVAWQFELDYPGIRDDARAVTYTRDGFGLRGDYGRPANIDVLTVGGSTTDQRYITDGRTWQDVLARRFRETGRDVRIANAGLNGRTTYGHLHDFEQWFALIPGLAPAYVLLYVGINDMFADRPHYRWDEAPLGDRSFARFIAERSVLYRLYRAASHRLTRRDRSIRRRSASDPGAAWTGEPLLDDHRERLASRVDGYRARLDTLLEHIEAMGAVPIVVTQPRGDYRLVDGRVEGLVDTQPTARVLHLDSAMGRLMPGTANGMDYYLMLSAFNAVSLDQCRRHNGICIDLAADLAFEPADFYDPTHTTADGARKIGEFLFDRLRHLFDPPGASDAVPVD